MDIKKERKRRGLTQKEFADLLGVTRKTIINYEGGGNIPDSKVKLFEKILNDSSTKEAIDSESYDKLMNKFSDIDDNEFSLYLDLNKQRLLDHPLVKSIIKKEAWKIIEKEMRTEIINETKD